MFDSLALLILPLAELFQLLLLLLFDPRVDRRSRVPVIRPSVGRTIVVRPFTASIVCRLIPRLAALLRSAGVVGRRRLVRIHLPGCRRLPRVVGRRRPIRIALYIGHLAASVVASRILVRIILTVRQRLARTISVVVRPLTLPIGTSVLRRNRARRRRHLDVRTFLLDHLTWHATHLRDCRRPAAIGLDLLLLLDERDRS